MFLIRSGAITGYQRLVASLGQNPVELLESTGLSSVQLRNPNTYVSYSKLAELLERTAAACGEPLFGLRLAELQTSSVLGGLAVTLSQHASVGDALSGVNRYLYLHARGVHVSRVEQGELLALGMVFDISSPLGIDQLTQLSVGQMATFTRDLLGPGEASFPLLLRQRDPGTGNGRAARHCAGKVEFDAAFDGICIPQRWLGRKPRFDEEAMRQHFQDYIAQLEQRYPDNLKDQVQDIIGRLLPSGECSVERVAATLDLQPRVLQKRLQKNGTSYVALLRESRLEIARQHLLARSMTITDLALNLGYADVSVFSRHFRLWTGLSPRAWQQCHTTRETA